MTKIAIVDDSQELLDKVKCLVKNYMGTAGRLFRVWCCTNPAALVSSILDGDRFDIYILDVEMPGSNGLEVAEKIREWQPVAKIIFLTSYLDYATKGYAVHALRYILKQNMDKDLPEALETALKSLDDANCACLMVSHYNNITRILHKDIMYVRKEHRSLQIFTTEQGVVSDSRGIKEVFDLLHKENSCWTTSGLSSRGCLKMSRKFCISSTTTGLANGLSRNAFVCPRTPSTGARFRFWQNYGKLKI